MDIDLHGKNVYQARITLTAALKRASNAQYRLRIIHGTQGGTALRDLVRTEMNLHPRVKRMEITQNPGETIYVLREYI